jgi:hypothetical protein
MKIMNKNIIILLLVIIGSSCTDFLDEKPKDRLTEINFYETFADAQAAVNAIYGPIRNNYRDTYFLMLDLLADYLEGRGSTSPVSEYKGFDVTNINRAAAAWRYLYQTIRNANIAIERIPKIEGMKESDKNALIAEASFLRAFSYYFLVRLWGAVPLYLDLSPVDLSRRPVSEVYQAIINDLKTGETYLPDTPSEFGHPTKWSAKSLLAEVYLTINEFDLSKDKAGEVITSGHFNLVDVNVANDFNNVYGPEANGTPEEIFYIKFNHTAGWTMPHKYLWDRDQFSPFGSYVVYCVPGPFFTNWDDNDLRKKFNIFSQYINRFTGEIETLPSSTPILVSKYRDNNAPSNSNYGNDAPVLRFADVLLIYAEAAPLAENQISAQALECLNRVKRRAYGYPNRSASAVDYSADGLSVEEFRDIVIQERAYELFMEGGDRWFDLRRIGREKEIILANTGKTLVDKHILWPIPQAEIDNNPDINQSDQNPGY